MTTSRQSFDAVNIDTKDMDTSKHLEFASTGVTWTDEEEKKLVRKIDMYLLPTMWLMYLLSYMDRTNIGNAKIAGMQTDLNLSSNEYSIALVVFFGTFGIVVGFCS